MKVYDLVVCGSGPSGVAAALAAARHGLKVVIIDDDEEIGGAPVDCYIQSFCGLPYTAIHREIREKMREFNPEVKENVGFRRATYILTIRSLLAEAGVEIITGRFINRVKVENKKITAIAADDFEIKAKMYIDATGNGDISVLAGCEGRYGRESYEEYKEAFAPDRADRRVQMCTQMFMLKRCADNDTVPNFARYNKDEFLIWGPTAECPDTSNPLEVNKTREMLISQMPKLAKEWLEKGFFITDIAPKLGVRESRRIKGKYTLKYSDVIERRRFEDSITIARYLIDPWEPEGNPLHSKKTAESCRVPYYEIPYRCLISDECENLLFCGRCISTTHVVNASVRVMPICYMTGQAAGTAAALTYESGNCHKVDIKALQSDLRNQGMFVTLDDEPQSEN